MSYLGLLDKTVTIIRDELTDEDRYGNPIPGETDEVVYACHLQPAPRSVAVSEEDTEDRNTQSSHYLLFLPADADVKGSDRLVIDGDVFEVDGPPRRFDNPRVAAEHHLEVSLKRIEGG